MKQSGAAIASAKTRPPLTFADTRIANTVLKFAKRDYDRPEVRADFERWKKEQAAKKAREDSK